MIELKMCSSHVDIPFSQIHARPLSAFQEYHFYNTLVILKSQGGSNSIIVCHYILNKLFKIYQSKKSTTAAML